MLVSQKKKCITAFQSSGSSKDDAPFLWTDTGKWDFHSNVYTSNGGPKERRKESRSSITSPTHKPKYTFLVLPWHTCSKALVHLSERLQTSVDSLASDSCCPFHLPISILPGPGEWNLGSHAARSLPFSPSQRSCQFNSESQGSRTALGDRVQFMFLSWPGSFHLRMMSQTGRK